MNRNKLQELAAECISDHPLVTIVKGKPNTPYAGRQFGLYVPKSLYAQCLRAAVAYGGEPADYLKDYVTFEMFTDGSIVFKELKHTPDLCGHSLEAPAQPEYLQLPE